MGKASSGLTDAEILEYTDDFLKHTIADQGYRRTVEPTVVLEVAFNNMQKSARHASGYALRFPRIVRIRTDKPVAEIDTLARAAELFERQSGKVEGAAKYSSTFVKPFIFNSSARTYADQVKPGMLFRIRINPQNPEVSLADRSEENWW